MRPEMGVLVCINMRDVDARRLHFANLCRGFGFDVLRGNASEQRPGSKVSHTFSKKRLPPITCSRIYQCRNSITSENRYAVYQHNMATNAQSSSRFSYVYRVLKRSSISHQRGRGYNA